MGLPEVLQLDLSLSFLLTLLLIDKFPVLSNPGGTLLFLEELFAFIESSDGDGKGDHNGGFSVGYHLNLNRQVLHWSICPARIHFNDHSVEH